MTHDRRAAARQRVRPGGRRATDPPLTTRDCADYMGVTTDFIRGAIREGVTHRGQLVLLSAEVVEINGKTVIRIHLEAFRAFLTALGWSRLPR